MLNLADLEELTGDLVRQEEGAAVIELGALVESLAGEDRHHGVVAGDTAPRLPRLLLGSSEVKERASAAPQAAVLGPGGVTTPDADEELVRRLGGLTGVDLDRVPVQGADLAVLDLVPRSIAGLDGLGHVLLLHRGARTLLKSVDHVLEVPPAEAVEFEVELLRLVTEHEGESARDSFVE